MQYLEILIAAFAAFMVGFGWYTALFGKEWQRLTGITDEEAASGMAMTHGLAFLMMAILAYGVNFIVNMHDLAEQTFAHGAFHGFLLGALYCLPALIIHYAYQRKPLKLYLIDGGYLVIFMALMGGILGALKLG